MQYQWDEQKRLSNLSKHHIDFMDVILFDWNTACIEQDARRDYGEPRYNAYGYGEPALFMVMTFTLRDSAIRVISYRKANERERRKYAQSDGTR